MIKLEDCRREKSNWIIMEMYTGNGFTATRSTVNFSFSLSLFFSFFHCIVSIKVFELTAQKIEIVNLSTEQVPCSWSNNLSVLCQPRPGMTRQRLWFHFYWVLGLCADFAIEKKRASWDMTFLKQMPACCDQYWYQRQNK